MKIKLYGEPNEKWWPSQLPLIKKGLLELGHELVENPQDADFLYANDPHGYEQIFFDKLRFNRKSLLTIHDIPEYQQDYHYIVSNYRKYLDIVDGISVNSFTTQHQVAKIFNKESYVIFQPTKEIIPLDIERDSKKLKFLFVGRANSSNKRFFLIKQLMEKYYSEKQLVVIGSENPGYGNYLGMVDDGQLSMYYNLSDYLLSPSMYEGLGLTPIESILAHKPVILSNDCAASNEFLSEFACDPNANSMHEKIEEIEHDRNNYNWIIQQYAKKYFELLNYKSVSENIVEVLNCL